MHKLCYKQSKIFTTKKWLDVSVIYERVTFKAFYPYWNQFLSSLSHRYVFVSRVLGECVTRDTKTRLCKRLVPFSLYLYPSSGNLPFFSDVFWKRLCSKTIDDYTSKQLQIDSGRLDILLILSIFNNSIYTDDSSFQYQIKIMNLRRYKRAF